MNAAPSLTLRAVDVAAQAYARVFADSPAAPVLSRRRPVRRTGFDLALRVARVRAEAEDVVSLTLVDPGGADLPRWVPGAHLDLFLPSGRQRQYSLCGDPSDRTRYRIAVRRIDAGGGGSVELHSDVATGAVVHVRGPRNGFALIDAPSYLFVAGGIGITPILPMTRATATRGARWHTVYLGRSRASMPFLDELTSLLGGVLEVAADDEKGRPDMAEMLSRAEPGAAMYVCGPPLMLEAARALMPTVNPSGSLHLERFSAPPVAGGAPFEVELARSGVRVGVAADESALAAIRRRLPDVAYSCQQGYCGTCKVAVVRGAVEHRDNRLSELERLDSMLICVSRGVSGSSLVIDL